MDELTAEIMELAERHEGAENLAVAGVLYALAGALSSGIADALAIYVGGFAEMQLEMLKEVRARNKAAQARWN